MRQHRHDVFLRLVHAHIRRAGQRTDVPAARIRVCSTQTNNSLLSLLTRPRGNDEVHGSLLRFDDTQAAFVPPAWNSDDHPLVYIQHNPDNFGSLLVSESNDTAFVTQYVALIGPDGRYRMIASEQPEGFDPNASFFHDEWIFLERDGRTVLRYGRDMSLAGSWVVERRGEGWILWWYEPREGNMGDLGEYVLVDVEVERVDDDEVEGAERAPAEEEDDSESTEEEADRVPGAGIYKGGWNEKGEWTGEGKWPGEGQSAGVGGRFGDRGGRGGPGRSGGRRG